MIKKFTKWGVQIIAFNDTDFLEATIRMFQPFVDKIVVSTGEKSWMGNVENDGTVEKVVSPLAKEFDNVNLVKGNWVTEAQQRNDNLRYLSECEYVFIVDGDEIWASGDINNVKQFALARSGYTVFRASWNTRFKKMDWIVSPREPFKPTVLIKNNKGNKFIENRQIQDGPNAAAILIPETVALIEHFSYVRSDDNKIKEKIKTFSHANEIIGGIDMWYENVYLQADLDSKDFHPTHPQCYKELVEYEIHPEIIRFLKSYSPQLFKK